MMIRLFRLSRRLTNDTVEGEQINQSLETEARPGDKRSIDLVEEEKDDQVPLKIQRFELEDGKDENSFELPEGMQEYVHKYMGLKIPDKELKEKVLSINPIPKNVKKTEELDSYIKELLVEHNKHMTMHVEKLLKTAQEKVQCILGPLSRLWLLTEGERQYVNMEDENESAHFRDIAGLFEQPVMLTSSNF